VVGGTHEWDRCTSLIGSVKDEPGQGDLRDLNIWVWTPGVHCVSFPLTGPTPGVPSYGGGRYAAVQRRVGWLAVIKITSSVCWACRAGGPAASP